MRLNGLAKKELFFRCVIDPENTSVIIDAEDNPPTVRVSQGDNFFRDALRLRDAALKLDIDSLPEINELL
jgi:hypothetical protein